MLKLTHCIIMLFLWLSFCQQVSEWCSIWPFTTAVHYVTASSVAVLSFWCPSYTITGGVGLVFPVGSVWVAALAGEQPTSRAQRPAGAQRALQQIELWIHGSAHAQRWLPGSSQHSNFSQGGLQNQYPHCFTYVVMHIWAKQCKTKV